MLDSLAEGFQTALLTDAGQLGLCTHLAARPVWGCLCADALHGL